MDNEVRRDVVKWGGLTAVFIALLLWIQQNSCGTTACNLLLLAAIALSPLLLLWLFARKRAEKLPVAIIQKQRDDDRQIRLLTAEQKRTTAVLETMSDGVIIVNESGAVQQINAAAAALFKMEEANAINRSIAEILGHYDLIVLWQRCRAEQKEQRADIEVGRDLFLEATITPITHQRDLSYLVILHDLTNIKRLETIRRDFISNISHELRTPLAALRAAVETLQDGALNDPAVADRFLGRALYEVDTLTQMVAELFELSRIESGQVPLMLEETAVSDFLQHAVSRFESQAARDNITLTLILPPDLPTVLADSNRVQQVVNNLLHNALKFTPTGEIVVQAFTMADAPKKAREKMEGLPPSLLFMVKDSGVGIPEHDLDRIFERFYKSDRNHTQKQKGTGLGLAIAKHLIEAHNGRLWAQSKPEKGSTFYFTLNTF